MVGNTIFKSGVERMKLTEEKTFVLRSEFIRSNLIAFIAKLDLPMVEVVIRPWAEKRTTTANRRLWKLHQLAGDHLGYSAAEMHEHALCRHFGYTELERADPLTGEIEHVRVPVRRSHRLSKRDFRDFMDATEAWYLADFGVWLDKDEQREAA